MECARYSRISQAVCCDTLLSAPGMIVGLFIFSTVGITPERFSRLAVALEPAHELKEDYTIAMVVHNMPQTARASDYTAFMYLGNLVEVGIPIRHSPAPPRSRPSTRSPVSYG